MTSAVGGLEQPGPLRNSFLCHFPQKDVGEEARLSPGCQESTGVGAAVCDLWCMILVQ